MKEVIITVTDTSGLVLFETSTTKMRNEIMEDFPNDDVTIVAGDLLDELEPELIKLETKETI